MFEVGDVVRFHSTIAGKEKFHLCLGRTENEAIFAFLFLNSGSGFRGDCVLDDGQFPGLPKSPTGKSVVSFSLLVRVKEEKLPAFGATKVGAIDGHLAGELAAFAKEVRSLTRQQQAFVVSALESLFI
ncbi:hypothetical protein [Maritimibacter sp. HL-12]|uniref:hypothetical protein n=1 Tax=Maritimibacter sp. HL-12 TaxID=1162418 RepID=UPI000A0F3788|nr:hypothetical protein [Maritimibacter sp. HL-12]SMH58203.1 hypothetical protein SAMN05661107_3566 [Maritimibacter sp. HL-12]